MAKSKMPQTQKCASPWCKAQITKQYGRGANKELCKQCKQSYSKTFGRLYF